MVICIEHDEAKKILFKRPALMTYFIFEINNLIDSGHTLSFTDARNAVETENILEYLTKNYNDSIDLSLFRGELKDAFNLLMSNICGGLYDRERRKTGIENNGLCLLIAYGTEMIQVVMI